ncbi:ferrous iron transport protein A [Desulfobacca acetoxidans]
MSTLWEASFDTPLRVVGLGKGLEDLRDLGITIGQVISKIKEENRYPILFLLTSKGHVLLPSGMSEKVIVTQDKKEIPLAKLAVGERAAIVNFRGGRQLRESLTILGLVIGEEIQLKTLLPVMRYLCLVDDKRHIALLSGLATKIWGRPASGRESCQLPLSPMGEPFQVEKLLGSKRAHMNLGTIGIRPQTLLRLKGIEPLPPLCMGEECAIIIETAMGLRLCLDKNQAEHIWVE